MRLQEFEAKLPTLVRFEINPDRPLISPTLLAMLGNKKQLYWNGSKPRHPASEDLRSSGVFTKTIHGENFSKKHQDYGQTAEVRQVCIRQHQAANFVKAICRNRKQSKEFAKSNQNKTKKR